MRQTKYNMLRAHFLFHGRFIISFIIFALMLFWIGAFRDYPLYQQSLWLLFFIVIILSSLWFYKRFMRPHITNYQLVQRLEKYNGFSPLATQPLNDFLIREKITDEEWSEIWINYQSRVAQHLGKISVIPISWLGNKRQLLFWLLINFSFIIMGGYFGSYHGWRNIAMPLFWGYISPSQHAAMIKISYRDPGNALQEFNINGRDHITVNVKNKGVIHILINDDAITNAPVLQINDKLRRFHHHRGRYFIDYQFDNLLVTRMDILGGDIILATINIQQQQSVNDINIDNMNDMMGHMNDEWDKIRFQIIQETNDDWHKLRFKIIQQNGISKGDQIIHKMLLENISKLPLSQESDMIEWLQESQRLSNLKRHNLKDMAKMIILADRMINKISSSSSAAAGIDKQDAFGRNIGAGNNIQTSDNSAQTETILVAQILQRITNALKESALLSSQRQFLLSLLED